MTWLDLINKLNTLPPEVLNKSAMTNFEDDSNDDFYEIMDITDLKLPWEDRPFPVIVLCKSSEW